MPDGPPPHRVRVAFMFNGLRPTPREQVFAQVRPVGIVELPQAPRNLTFHARPGSREAAAAEGVWLPNIVPAATRR